MVGTRYTMFDIQFFITLRNTREIILDPWSDWIIFGKPKVVQNLMMAFTIAGVFKVRSGIASRNLVAKHIKVNKYEWPDFVLGKGPTQSITSFSKGSLITGTGFNGAGATTWLGFPAIWQAWHDRHYWVTLAFMPGQKKCVNRLL